MFDVAIIGAGASGVLLAAHLQRTASRLRVALIDAGARAARGLAYGTPYGAHLLNVPAAKMSAYSDRPEHFLEWLQGPMPGATGKTFAPRSLYGEYLANVLAEAHEITRIPGTAVGLSREESRWRVHLHDDRRILATSVVLALGNLPPADPIAHTASKHYLRDPWAPGVAQGLAPDAPILLIGTGLTMVDLALALRAEGHRGTIHALSRRGLLPRAHVAHLPLTLEVPSDVVSPRELLRWVRSEIASLEWRAVIDALRPVTSTIWQRWSLAQRASFLRHLRPYWDVHRHRTAPEVAAQIEAMRDAGTLQIHRGRIQSLTDVADGVVVRFRKLGEERELRVARVINCTGPASDYATVDLPLVVQLRRAGWLVPDPLGLGVEADEQGRLVPDLFTIGPLRKPQLWESTAIPEIRGQAAELAMLLAGRMRNVKRA